MSDDLRHRQLELEKEAIGLGLERAWRIVSGERKPEDVEAFGGDKMEGAAPRRNGLCYTIAASEMSKLIGAIEKARNKGGTKAAAIFNVLKQCGNDGEIAGVVIKIFFSTLCTRKEDDDAPGVPGNDSVVGMAEKVADAVLHLFQKEKPQKRKKRKIGKKNSRTTPEGIKKPKSKEERLRIGLYLTYLYLSSTACFKSTNRIMSVSTVEATGKVFSGFFEELSHEGNAGNASEQDIVKRPLERWVVSPVWMPMLVPPKPWSSMRDGGYIGRLARSMSLVKGRGRMTGFSKESCPEVFEAVNHLQETGFRVNSFIFNIFNPMFRNLLEKIKLREPDDSGFDHRELDRFETLLDIPKTVMQSYFSNDRSGAVRSLRQSLPRLLLLSREAEMFLSSSFYFVHYCDYRGRVYPRTGNLDYQAGDLPRSLIEFSEGKSIADSEAERWFAVHGANCYAEKKDGIGMDKSAFDDRLAWVRNNEKSIIALGAPAGAFWTLPVELEEWWLKADKPWAFLAWAHDWAMYKADRVGYQSHLPVAVDGSSNGYQHIAALLRSQRLAEEVNMLPSIRPFDIYATVASDARKDIEQYRDENLDMETLYLEHRKQSTQKKSGKPSDDFQLNDVDKRVLANSLKGELPRKAAKKLVMTYPYSATVYSMTQALNKLHDKELKEGRSLFQQWCESDLDPEFDDYPSEIQRVNLRAQSLNRILPRLLAEAIRESIDRSFPEVTDLLTWLKGIGNRASVNCSVIEWTSPCGFVIQQDYEEKKAIPIHVLGHKANFMMGTGKSDRKSHASGLGPNFIHSCDAAHMMRTVNAASKAGIGSLRMIHDSYATHAADVGKLSRILREEFIGMYSNADWLTHLGEGLSEQAGVKFTVDPAPIVGDFDISQVLGADYFFA